MVITRKGDVYIAMYKTNGTVYVGFNRCRKIAIQCCIASIMD